jgi:hypothetical protein
MDEAEIREHAMRTVYECIDRLIATHAAAFSDGDADDELVVEAIMDGAVDALAMVMRAADFDRGFAVLICVNSIFSAYTQKSAMN